ncbi:MAG: diguanylate cyclase [Eubacteriaceae bacterium]|nr:diguanylate cyclase [Eubacteriaceae bacterium]
MDYLLNYIQRQLSNEGKITHPIAIVLNSLPFDFFITDNQHRLLYINARSIENYKIPADYIGKPCSTLCEKFCPNPIANCACDRLDRQGSNKITIVAANSRKVVTSSHLKTSDGKIIGYFEMITDVTEYEEVQDTLNAIVNSAPCGIFRIIYDPDNILKSQIVFINQALLKLYGFSEHTPTSKIKIDRLVDAQDQKRTIAILSEAFIHHTQVISVEFRLKTKDGQIKWVSCGCGIDYSQGLPIINGLELDITKSKVLEQKRFEIQRERVITFRTKAQQDSLTGLFNREAFETSVNIVLKNHPPDLLAAMFMIDLDNFKSINDYFGHDTGDQILTIFSIRLKRHLRKNDIIGRLGGDEFAVLLPEITSADYIHKKALELCKALSFEYHSHVSATNGYQVSCSIGIAAFNRHGSNFAQLYSKADQALYTAKDRGKNQYSIFGEKGYVSKGASWMNREWLIDELEELVYISSTTTYNMIYLNRTGRKLTGIDERDYTGRKCYEIMRGRSTPCPHCNNAHLTPDHFISWENHNGHLNKTFIMKAKLVSWDGILCRMEYAVDLDADPQLSEEMKQHL